MCTRYKKSVAGPYILARAFRALLLMLIYPRHMSRPMFFQGASAKVLQLVGEGKSTRDIAVQLGISVKTAESHRTRLRKKLDVHETTSLVRYPIRRGVIQA